MSVCAAVGQPPDLISLAGDWRLRLDPEDQGLTADWPSRPLITADHISLPNTTDRAGFGFALETNSMLHAVPFPVTTHFPGVKEPTRADERGFLVRKHLFVGPAWYTSVTSRFPSPGRVASSTSASNAPCGRPTFGSMGVLAVPATGLWPSTGMNWAHFALAGTGLRCASTTG